MEYPKTENLYASNGAQDGTRRSGPEFGYRMPAVGQISQWLVTEKVDGMNMRVVFRTVDGDHGPYSTVDIFGRTDRAQIPGDLKQHMGELFNVLTVRRVFDKSDPGEPEGSYPAKVVLYGEGFGPGIQNAGQAYGGSKRFVLFDVLLQATPESKPYWLCWDAVESIAADFGCPTVPVLARGVDLEEAKAYVWETDLLPAGSEHIEGIVGRTDPYLFDGAGRRVMFKYKVRDL